MELISSAERNRLFDRFHHDAFHLELRDDYSVPDEDGPFHQWLAGRETDHSYLEPWLRLVHQSTARGMSVRRVRVVTTPPTPYIRWEHSITELNEGAGEDIRWLPRHLLPADLTLPFESRDWWLYDDRLLAVGHCDDDGRVLGSEIVDTPDVVDRCAHVRDQLWALAVPTASTSPEQTMTTQAQEALQASPTASTTGS